MRHNMKQGAPVITAAIALTVLSFFLGAMTSSGMKSVRQNPQHFPVPQACAAIAEITAGNDLYAGAR